MSSSRKEEDLRSTSTAGILALLMLIVPVVVVIAGADHAKGYVGSAPRSPLAVAPLAADTVVRQTVREDELLAIIDRFQGVNGRANLVAKVINGKGMARIEGAANARNLVYDLPALVEHDPDFPERQNHDMVARLVAITPAVVLGKDVSKFSKIIVNLDDGVTKRTFQFPIAHRFFPLSDQRLFHQAVELVSHCVLFRSVTSKVGEEYCVINVKPRVYPAPTNDIKRILAFLNYSVRPFDPKSPDKILSIFYDDRYGAGMIQYDCWIDSL